MTDPPAEVHEGQCERAEEGAREEDEADDDGEVGEATGQKERVRRSDGERGEEEEADCQQSPRRRGPRIGDGGDETWHQDPHETDRQDRDDDDRDEPEEERDRRSCVEQREAREREHGGADRERCGSGQGDHSVLSHHHARSHEAVDREERGHDREPTCDDDGPRVTASRPDGHQSEGGQRSGQRADADAVEMHPEWRHHHDSAEQPHHENREHGDADQKPGSGIGRRCRISGLSTDTRRF